MSDRKYEKRPRSFGKKETFRAFIAIDIEQGAKNELSRLANEIRLFCKGSYPSSDMYHMTIAFLGDITYEEAFSLCDSLEDLNYSSFDLILCRLGYFNQFDNATVFCSTEKEQKLNNLARDVYRRAWDCGIDFDDKQFRAHITLGRRVDLSSIRLDSILVNRISFKVKGLSLYKSTLRPCGPKYEVVRTINF